MLHTQKIINAHEKGIALFIIIIFVLLSTLLATWASRSAIFNEIILSNEADYQRAFEAAQALIQDAELDIRNELSNGDPCEKDSINLKICRIGSQYLRFPAEEQEVSGLFSELLSIPSSQPPCKDGICLKNHKEQDFWNNDDASQGITFAQMQSVGARYGEFTGAQIGQNSNPILSDHSQNRGAWYWVEVLSYSKDAANTGLLVDSNTNILPLRLEPNIIYRITAVARGLKSNTVISIQQTYARQRLQD